MPNEVVSQRVFMGSPLPRRLAWHSASAMECWGAFVPDQEEFWKMARRRKKTARNGPRCRPAVGERGEISSAGSVQPKASNWSTLKCRKRERPVCRRRAQRKLFTEVVEGALTVQEGEVSPHAANGARQKCGGVLEARQRRSQLRGNRLVWWC